MKNAYTPLSLQMLRRLPEYLHYLKRERENGAAVVSAAQTARHFGYTEVQVRKDFAAISENGGKPKAGFATDDLIFGIEHVLGFHNTNEAALVGTGHLGQALLAYDGFASYGLKIVVAFDADKALAGSTVAGVPVLPPDKISEMCRRMRVPIGILTVPATAAQLVCDQFVAGGVRAIWNFTNVSLAVPEGVLVQNENMAVSFALLSRHLAATTEETGK